MVRQRRPHSRGSGTLRPTSRLVVDASVAAKWLFDEMGSTSADELLEPPYDISAPDLILLEVGNVVWKKRRSGQISDDGGRDALRMLRSIPVRIEPSTPLLEEAWEIALAYDRSVYDGIYLALSVARDAPLVTADRRLRNALSAGPLRDRVWGLEDLPR